MAFRCATGSGVSLTGRRSVCRAGMASASRVAVSFTGADPVTVRAASRSG
jgi:hypothetical protein